MAGSIYDWSTTAGNNGSSDEDIDWSEGQAPSTVNNSARQLMGRIAELLGDEGGALSAGGTPNGITVTANSDFTSYANGRIIAFKAASDNTGSTTLNVNEIGSKAIRKITTSGDVALEGGEIQEDGIFVFRYNSSLNSSAGGWQILNPARRSILNEDNTFTGDNTFEGDVDVEGALTLDNSATMSVDTDARWTVRNTNVGCDVILNATNNDVGRVGTHTNDPFVIVTNNSTRMTFSTNGNVEVDNGNLTVNGSITADSYVGVDEVTAGTGINVSSGEVSVSSDVWRDGNTPSGGTGINTSSGSISVSSDVWRDGNTPSANQIAGVLDGNTATVDFDGTLRVGVDAGNSPGEGHIQASADGQDWHMAFRGADNTGEANFIRFRGNTDGFGGSQNSVLGSIEQDESNVAYNTSSDHRLKDQIADLSDSGTVIDAIQPRSFVWKESGKPAAGFVAHELAEALPGAVKGEKDAVDEEGNIEPQQVAYANPGLIAHIVAELKALRKRVAELET